jgi:Holliday junction resolvase RusA-like endonuclease
MACRSIIIPGKPLGKQRPRVLRTGIAYTPKETVTYETFVKMLYLEKYAGEKPFEGPVAMLISAFYQIPKSASKRRREAMARHHIPPTTKPDLDNIAKIIMDALAGVAYEDDKQITSCSINKLYSDEPKVIVNIVGEVDPA